MYPHSQQRSCWMNFHSGLKGDWPVTINSHVVFVHTDGSRPMAASIALREVEMI